MKKARTCVLRNRGRFDGGSSLAEKSDYMEIYAREYMREKHISILRAYVRSRICALSSTKKLRYFLFSTSAVAIVSGTNNVYTNDGCGNEVSMETERRFRARGDKSKETRGRIYYYTDDVFVSPYSGVLLTRKRHFF